MKTTVELPDRLLRQAKKVALKRRITFKELLTSALQREILPIEESQETVFKVGEDGMPYLPSRNVKVTSNTVADILDSEEY